MLKLTIAQKLALSSLLFLLPIVYVISALIAQQNIGIDFGLKEREGTLYLRGLQALDFDLANASMLGASLDGATLAKAIDDLEAAHGEGMESASLAHEAAAAFKALSTGAQAEIEAARVALRGLIARIGDKSNLILDPDLDSFYVMDLILLKLPDITDRTAAMTALARKDWSDGVIGTDEQVDFFVALGGLKSLVEGTDASVASGYSGNGDGSLKANLDAAYGQEKQAMEALSGTVGKGAISDGQAASTLHALETFYATSSAELDRLLTKRVDGFKSEQVTTLLVTVVLFLLAIGAVLAMIMRSVIRPLGRLTSSMRQLAGGDLNVDVAQADERHEIGDMARALNVLRENSMRARALESEKEAEQRHQTERNRRTETAIASFEAHIGSIVDVLRKSSAELETTARSMSTTASETSQQVSAVANASAATSANVQTVAAATEELSASVGGIRQHVSEASRIVTQAVGQAGSATGRIRKLGEAATKIGQVITLINDIASRTNLLALNATIEAARAGASGKGFAVVATEVKSLANQTARATEDIVAQVREIQEETRISAESIDVIAATINRVSEVSTSIATAVEQQGGATQEIARSVSLAASGTSDVAANVSAVTQAAQSTGAASQRVLTAARDLAKQSNGFDEHIAEFLRAVRA